MHLADMWVGKIRGICVRGEKIELAWMGYFGHLSENVTKLESQL